MTDPFSEQARDRIDPQTAGSLSGLFFERLARSPDAVAYRQFDPGQDAWVNTTWSEMAVEVGRIQAAFRRDGLAAGDRIALMLRNGREWVLFDQAALGLGLVTVPLYTDDRPENVGRIIRETDARMLVVDGRRQWRRLVEMDDHFPELLRIVSLSRIEAGERHGERKLLSFSDWTFGLSNEPQRLAASGETLASIVYTSGTAGEPRGVMLSHGAVLANAWACSEVAAITPHDRFLSFLPLSHMLERTAGYYLPMLCGSQVVFARSVQQLAEDLLSQSPTLMISVPRVYERIHTRLQRGLSQRGALTRYLFRQAVSTGWRRYLRAQGRPCQGWRPPDLLWPLLDRRIGRLLRQRLGGRLRFAICGGAPLSVELAREFTALGVPVLHGYGLTEAGPVVSVNRPVDNRPDGIGPPLTGVEVRIGHQDELLVRGPSLMAGYWRDQAATAQAFDADGWLHTGDQGQQGAQGHLRIIGRLKDIIVMSNGEKVAPAALEAAIGLDPLFEQVLVVGEGRPWLAALIVLDAEQWQSFAQDCSVDADDPMALRDRYVERRVLRRIGRSISAFPGYAQVRRVGLLANPWTVESGLLTPTQKLRRAQILREHAALVDSLYASMG